MVTFPIVCIKYLESDLGNKYDKMLLLKRKVFFCLNKLIKISLKTENYY